MNGPVRQSSIYSIISRRKLLAQQPRAPRGGDSTRKRSTRRSSRPLCRAERKESGRKHRCAARVGWSESPTCPGRPIVLGARPSRRVPHSLTGYPLVLRGPYENVTSGCQLGDESTGQYERQGSTRAVDVGHRRAEPSQRTSPEQMRVPALL